METNNEIIKAFNELIFLLWYFLSLTLLLVLLVHLLRKLLYLTSFFIQVLYYTANKKKIQEELKEYSKNHDSAKLAIQASGKVKQSE